MKQPQFTLWPWGTLAVAVPAMALVTAFIAAQQSQQLEDVFTVFFGVLAAANAYLFAMGIGDFGRSIIAIPCGAVAGFLAVRIFAYAPVSVLFLLLVGFYMARLGPGKIALGCFAGFLALLTLAAATGSGGGGGAAVLCGLCAYPFTCACVAATMPLENTSEGVAAAATVGLSAALRGMMFGWPAFAVCAVLASAVRSSGPPAPAGQNMDNGILVAGVPGLLVANYFCIKQVFTGIHRVEVPEKPPEAGPPQEPAPPKEAPYTNPGAVWLPLPQPKIKLPEDEAGEEHQAEDNSNA
ncbi:MAG: hypothetical protein ABSE73_11595 [Planctomycetota bacterium]